MKCRLPAKGAGPLAGWKECLWHGGLLFVIFTVIFLSGCQEVGREAKKPDEKPEVLEKNCLDIRYATQFGVDQLAGGCYSLTIGETSAANPETYLLKPETYLLMPEGAEAPKDGGEGMTRIDLEAEHIYLAASSAMDLIRELDALDHVRFTSTEKWSVPGIEERLKSEELYYIGRYSAPDYEALLEGDCDLAVESTMINHSPRIREEIEGLGIPVLTERSSYEQDPLGRLEWIKLYGLLTGRQEEAEAFFDEACEEVSDVIEERDGDETSRSTFAKTPKTAFFSVTNNGVVVVRRPGDYITRMIETAGGEYVPGELSGLEDSSGAGNAPTARIQMEAFVKEAAGADILIYNSAIEGDLSSLDQLRDRLELLDEFRAAKAGRVWCTTGGVFQESTGIAGMITELRQIMTGEGDSGMKYFRRLR